MKTLETQVSMKKIAYSICNLISTLIHPVIKLWSYFGGHSRVRILVYHRVCPLPKENGVEYYNVHPSSFADQIRFLTSNKYNVMSIDEVIELISSNRPIPKRSICITFDDGYKNNYTHVFPVLSSQRIKATFFLATSWIDNKNRFPWLRSDEELLEAERRSQDVSIPLCWSEVAEMDSAGMVFGNHSATHGDLSLMSLDQVRSDVLSGHRDLEAHVSRISRVFVCPFGVTPERGRQLKLLISELGYKGAIWGRVGSVGENTDPFDLPRISVYEGDSLEIFERKIDGAYDWLGIAQPIWSDFSRLIFKMRRSV